MGDGVGVEFRLLGPLEVRAGGRLVQVGSPKLRVLVARLLLDVGRPVSTAELAGAIWGDRLPENPRRAVQVSVTRLRALLAIEDLIRTWPDGYSIEATPDQVDVGRFHAWLAEAGQAAARDDPAKEAAALAEALAQWRGEPLADVPSEVLERETVPRLREQRLRALERRIELALRQGRHADLVGELRELTARHRVRERLWGQLMRALDASGQRADALDAYHMLRRHLTEELGIEPGEELRRLHTEILAGRPSDGGPAAAAPAGADRLPTPRQLPADLPGFVGRTEALARLDAVVTQAAAGVRVVVIAGTAGVGKTALAAHWARRVADRFPDGQLWVNLRGYDPGQEVPTGQALTRILRALGVPGEQISLDVEDQAALYRTVTDGRRILVVVDNARSAEQVRPLLPGASGSLVVVGSRSRLAGLVAVDGAQGLTLDLFTVDESRQLLAHRLGHERVRARPQAVHEIIHRSARLPLALAIVAARAAAHPDSGLDLLAAELRSAGDDLDVFATGDASTDIRTVFSWSYQALSPDAARLFRLLGLHPGPDLAIAAAASLAGVSVQEARALVTELVRAHLLTEPTPGRFAFHDLLRAYAAERVHAEETDTERHEAVRRMLRSYLHTAHAAVSQLDPHRDAITLEPVPAGVATERVADREQALAWFAAEHSALLAVVDLAVADKLDTYAWQLPWTMIKYLDMRGHWNDLIRTQHLAVEAARRLADHGSQARSHRNLGVAYGWVGDHSAALEQLQAAADHYRRLDDHAGEAYTEIALAWVCENQRRYETALSHARRALDLFRAAGHRVGEGRALNAVGWHQALAGDYRSALVSCRQALALLAGTDDRDTVARTWDSLGYAHQHLGDYEQAAACYRRAVQMHRDFGSRYFEANTLARLGDIYRAAADLDSAREAWSRALDILTELDHPTAAAVADKLADLDGTVHTA